MTIIMQFLQNMCVCFSFIFFLLLSVGHNQLTKAEFLNNHSYQYANIKISILGEPKVFISLAKFITLNLIQLLGSHSRPAATTVQKYFLRRPREESQIQVTQIRFLRIQKEEKLSRIITLCLINKESYMLESSFNKNIRYNKHRMFISILET